MRRPLAVAASIVLMTGCTASYRVQPNDPIAPGTTVRIRFDSPRDLEARRDTTVYPLPAISRVYGRVESVRGDTLVLRNLALESSARQPRLPREARLELPRDTFAEISTRRRSSGRTAGAMFGVTVVALFVVMLSSSDFLAH